MKVRRKKILIFTVIIVTICIVLRLVILSSFYVNIGKVRYNHFWKNPKEYDVWFMGSSHMYYATSPMQIWKDFGIKSYNLSSPCATMPVEYWTLKCALEKAKPSVIVLDTYYAMNDNMIKGQNTKKHANLDGIPFSYIKLKACDDIFSSMRSKISYGFALKSNQYLVSKNNKNIEIFNYSLGGDRSVDVEDNSEYLFNKKKILKKETKGIIYLKKIIKECKKRNIKIVLTALPYYGSVENKHEGMNTAKEIARKENIPFIDFREKGVCDIDSSCEIGDVEHINSLGESKVSNYIGNYLKRNIKFDKKTNDIECTKKWNKKYESYLKFLEKRCSESKNIRSCLLWVADNSHQIFLYKKAKNYKTNKKILKNEKLDNKAIKKMKNLKLVTYEQAKKYVGYNFKEDSCVIVKNRLTKKTVCKILFNGRQRVKEIL